MKETTSFKRLFHLRILLLIFVLTSALGFSFYVFRWIDRPTFGFAMYYTYSRMVLEGEDFSKAYDFDYFNSKIHEYGINTIDMPNNLPTASLPMLSFAWLSPPATKTIWTLISVGLFLASLRILLRLFDISLSNPLGLTLITVAFLFRPVYDGIALGQMYFVILFLFSICMLAISSKQTTLAAIPVGVAFVIKGYGLVPMIWLGFHRFWKTLLIMVGVILGIFILTIPIFGVEAWKVFYETVVVQLGSRPSDANVAYQTINGFFRHLFSYDPQWLPYPLVKLPDLLVQAIVYITNLLLIIYVLKGTRGSYKGLMLSFAAATAAGVVTAPLAEEYHFILFLPLIFGIASHLFSARSRIFPLTVNEIVFVVATLMLAAPIKYKALADARFPLILLAYPKLYAGIALLFSYKKVGIPQVVFNSKSSG